MKRPLFSRILPARLKSSIYYRYYHHRHADWRGLFEVAPLYLAPQIAMYDLLPGDIVSGNIAFNGFLEYDLSKRILEIGRALRSRDPLFVDVGANMGYFSLLWAGATMSGRAIAIEASPRNIKLVRNNIERNQLSDRITVIPKAAGKASGTTTFDVGSSEQTGWGGITNVASKETVEVPLIRLDEELCDEVIDVMKIDVEGADTWVLEGCESLLKRQRIHKIFFEENTVRMKALGIASGEARAFLQGLGYECLPFGQGEWMAYPKSKL